MIDVIFDKNLFDTMKSYGVKVKYIDKVFEKTQNEIFKDEAAFKSFLDFNVTLYSIPYTQSVDIYAQNPNATTIATYKDWHKMGVHVLRHAKGIATYDRTNNGSNIVYYFDISNTDMPGYERWSLNENNKFIFKNYIVAKYDAADIVNQGINSVLDYVSTVYMFIYAHSDRRYFISDDIFDFGKDTLKYMLLKRLGQDTSDIHFNLNLFSGSEAELRNNLLSSISDYTSDFFVPLGKQILSHNKVIRELNIAQKRLEEIKSMSGDFKIQNTIFDRFDFGVDEEKEIIDESINESQPPSIDGAVESTIIVPEAEEPELPEEKVSSNPEILKFSSLEESDKTFNLLSTNINISSDYTSFSPKLEKDIPYQYIKDVILRGSGFVDGKKRISKFFENYVDENDRINLIRKEYGLGGAGWPLEGYGVHGYDSFSPKGIKIEWRDAEGEKIGYLPWRSVEHEIGALILSGEYLPNINPEPAEQEIEDIDTSDEILDNNNFTITPSTIHYTPKEKYANNVAAIVLLKELESSNRSITPEEKNILSNYSGWGGLSDAFDVTKWPREYEELKNLLTTEEYNAARGSTLNAHYTSANIILKMYTLIEGLGYSGGNILEPSMGIGNFFGLLPDNLKENSNLYGVELDSISGRIAKLLYPNAHIQIKGYEETSFENNFFSIAIGNVPFGQYKVTDKTYESHNFLIHDYFFAKTLDKVRPGGIVAFITSKGTLDKKDSTVREYLAHRAELVGAMRLPNNAFSEAGTKVTSDIIFLRKREDYLSDISNEEWITLEKDYNGIEVNNYFINHPNMILGTMQMVSGPFGPESQCIATESLDTLMTAAVEEILVDNQERILENTSRFRSIQLDLPIRDFNEIDIDKITNFTYFISNGSVYFKNNTEIEKHDEIDINAAKAYLSLVSATKNLIELQKNDESLEKIQEAQIRLNTVYDSYVERYNRINFDAGRKRSIFSTQRYFDDDNFFPLVSSLEVYDEDGNFVDKSDIFYKRTITPTQEITHCDTCADALSVSLTTKGVVDIDYISSLTNHSINEVLDSLKDLIIKEPVTQKYVTIADYASGNIRDKLNIAIEYSNADESYKKNVEILEKAMPEPLSPADISVKLGTPWLNPEYIKEFLIDVFKTPVRYIKYDNISVEYSKECNVWHISNKNLHGGDIPCKKYGTNRINGYDLLEKSLNMKFAQIYDVVDRDGREVRVLNPRETQIALAKQSELKSDFQNWIMSDPVRAQDIADTYNTLFNSHKPREYDGSQLTFPGMNMGIQLEQHQKDAIAQIIYGGSTLIGHVVGAGKTYTMIAAAMELKRMGLCSKPMFVVPNHLVQQWSNDFMRLYPSANILASSKKDFTTENRKKFCSRIATGNYDAVIIAHSQFEKIPLSQERQKAFIEQEIAEIVEHISEEKYNRNKNFTVKQMELTVKQLRTKLEKLNNATTKDNVVDFESLGVDRIFVDEAHSFKNMYINTKMSNVAGIQTSEANKSFDLFSKCRYMDEIVPGKGIIFATGTPISNSMCEMYTMQRYLQYNTLKKCGLDNFDAWAATFGEVVSENEITPEGGGYRLKSRFSKFTNLPELMSIFRECATIKTADTLNLAVPNATYETITCKPNVYQKEMLARLVERAERVRNGSVDPREDNMLTITNDGRKLALDARLIDDTLPDEAESKVNVLVDTAYRIYEDTSDKKLTQVIFCDLSTPKDDGSFSVYTDIKAKLISRGVPADEIAFIHDAKNDLDKQQLFTKVNTGTVRFILGSTAKMGAGTNMQHKLIALHHLDVPWKPSDIEQREGRIIRRGNENKDVKIYRYVTSSTFDAYSWQIIENKLKFISQVMTSKAIPRSCDEIDECVLSAAQVKACACDNPLIKEEIDLSTELNTLTLLKSNYISNRMAIQKNVEIVYPKKLSQLTEILNQINEDIERYNSNKISTDDEFKCIINDCSYNSKKEAGIALLASVNEINKPFTGEYCGFKLSREYNAIYGCYDLELIGSHKYSVIIGSDPIGQITRINNSLDNLTKFQSEYEAKIQDTKDAIIVAETELAKPFEKEEQLRKVTARHNEVLYLLSHTEEGPPELTTNDNSLSKLCDASLNYFPSVEPEDELHI